MSEPVLRIEQLTKRFGGLTAVDALEPPPRRRPAARHHRSERRRQDHLLQSDLRPAGAGQRASLLPRPRHHRAQAAPDQPARHQAHAADQERVSHAHGRGQSVDHRRSRTWAARSVPPGGARPRHARAGRAHARADRADGARGPPGRHAVVRRRRAARDRHGADLDAAAAAARRADLRHEPGRDRAGGRQDPRARALDRHRHHRARHGGRVRDRRRHHRHGAGRQSSPPARRRRSPPTSACARPISAVPRTRTMSRRRRHA